MTERAELMRRALEHYANRLSALQDDQEIKLGNSMLKDDLNTNASNALMMANSLRNPILLNIVISDYYEIADSALTCYIRDLEESKKVVSARLGGAKPKMKNIDIEIEEAKKAKADISSSLPPSPST